MECNHEYKCSHLSIYEDTDETPLEITKKLLITFMPKLPLFKYVDNIKLYKCSGHTNQVEHYVVSEKMTKATKTKIGFASNCKKCANLRRKINVKLRTCRFKYAKTDIKFKTPVLVRCSGLTIREAHWVLPSLMQVDVTKSNNIGHCCKICNNNAKYNGVNIFGKLLYGGNRQSRKRRREFDNSDFSGDEGIKLLMELFIKQQGKCAYTGITLQFQKAHPHRLSLERIDPSQGYIDGNVCFITRMLNTPAQWSRDLIQQIHSFKGGHFCQRCCSISKSLYYCVDCVNMYVPMVTTGFGQWSCLLCGHDADTKHGKYCELCRPHYQVSYNRIYHRLYESSKRRKFDCDLTDKYVQEMVKKQTCCQYSGIPFVYNHGRNGKFGVFSPSLERIDTTIGYLKSNVILICAGFNNSDLLKQCVDIIPKFRTTWCKNSCEHLLNLPK